MQSAKVQPELSILSHRLRSMMLSTAALYGSSPKSQEDTMAAQTNSSFKPFRLTRRRLLQTCSAAAAAWSLPHPAAAQNDADPLLKDAISRLEYLTPLDRAFILDKGKTGVTKLPPEKLREIGLVPETWSLDVVPDPASNNVVAQPIARTLGNALT